jgi:hypothetical protein
MTPAHQLYLYIIWMTSATLLLFCHASIVDKPYLRHGLSVDDVRLRPWIEQYIGAEQKKNIEYLRL